MSDRSIVQDRTADLSKLVHRTSLECAHARWFDCDEIVEHLTRSLAGTLGATVVELAWTEDHPSDPLMRTGIYWATRSDDAWAEPDRGVNEVFEPFSLEETSDSTVVHQQDLPEGSGAWARAGYEAAGLDCAVEILVSPRAPRAMIRLGFSDGGGRWRAIHSEAVGHIALMLMSTLRRCEAERRLEERVRRDSLTGLVNREELYRRLGECISSAVAHPKSIGVIYADLDHFKAVNDRFGHQVGDGALKSVAAVLSETLRDGDFAARSGGDEFVIVCMGLRSQREIQAIAKRIQAGVSQLEVEGMRMGISVGCALNDGPMSADELVGLADSDMYANKRAAALREIAHARW
jgi:diguanylate cyclase (GGDEF)-like protein